MKKYRDGPVESFDFPAKLKAHVVEPGPAPRIHGYDVQADLAHHYRFSDTLRLCLAGDLPDPAQGEQLGVALQFLAPSPINEAPAHAALLSRMCAATPAAVVANGAMALAEQAQRIVADHRPWLAWLDDPAGDLPPGFSASDDGERQAVARLQSALGDAPVCARALSADPTLTAALLAVLHGCGLQRAEHLIAAITVARLPSVTAEAFAVATTAFRDYPMDLPPFRYEDP